MEEMRSEPRFPGEPAARQMGGITCVVEGRVEEDQDWGPLRTAVWSQNQIVHTSQTSI